MKKSEEKKSTQTKESRKYDLDSVRNRSMTQLDRLATQYDYAAKFTSKNLSNLFLVYGAMDAAELAHNLKNPNLTYIEKSVIYIITQMKTSSKNSLEAIKYFHDRAVGKLPQGIEHSGNPDRPVVLVNEEQELEEIFKKLSPEELKTVEALMLQIGNSSGAEQPAATAK